MKKQLKNKENLEKHVVVKPLFGSTFEAFEARVVYNSISVTLNRLYRPPYSKQNKNTNDTFLDEFPDFLHSIINSKGEVIVMADFEFYFHNQHDSEVCNLKSLLHDCCLQQLVYQPIHRRGHTPDWAIDRFCHHRRC